MSYVVTVILCGVCFVFGWAICAIVSFNKFIGLCEDLVERVEKLRITGENANPTTGNPMLWAHNDTLDRVIRIIKGMGGLR